MAKLKKCQHCGSRIRAKNHRIFCTIFCAFEHRKDGLVNQQRLDTFQALAETGSWLALDNITLHTLANPHRRVKLLEKQQVKAITCYRLTKAGYKLLERWKSRLQVSA